MVIAHQEYGWQYRQYSHHNICRIYPKTSIVAFDLAQKNGPHKNTNIWYWITFLGAVHCLELKKRIDVISPFQNGKIFP